ncbi:MAG: undecaprenyl-diphosphate phosphatase [Candidatus Sericytochromatia bacterium]|nr:undecaprenyl-diphosphate phosphatase [Candidatus Tanganyikabacteria bacterium]
MNFLQALVLGIVQGITEFLPISSTAHLILARLLLGVEKSPSDLSIDVVFNFVTFIPVVWYFWGDLKNVAAGGLRSFKKLDLRGDPEQRLAWFLVIGCIPGGLLGIMGERVMDHLRTPLVIGIAMVGFAFLLWFAEAVGKRERDIESIKWKHVLLIGLFQGLAVIPGASRSGVTITAGLLAGMQREAAARFAFLLGLPIMLAAMVYEARKLQLTDFTLPVIGGAITAIVAGYLSIRFLMAFLRTRSTMVFIVYRLVVGTAIIALALTGRFPGA